VSTVLELDGVWKGYRDLSRGPRTLRASLVGGGALRRRRTPLRWALRDVSLRVARGESLGIVGRNGAGKSTLLRLASHLGRPTRGSIRVEPDSASVLNLGASFDLQLTGRENAFTAALVAGLTARQARALLVGALAFAELEDFADAPVRTYSEGMKLRLAFGVIASLRPRLLVLDEVLAVGDVGFRAKCQAHIQEMREAGTSLVLASHSMDEVVATCRQAVWLEDGAIRAAGDPQEVLQRYESATRVETLARTPEGLGEDRIGSLEVEVVAAALNGWPAAGRVELRSGEPLEVRLTLAGDPERLAAALVSVSLRRERDGVVALDLSSEAAAMPIGRNDGVVDAYAVVDRLDLAPGEYRLDLGVFAADWGYAYDFRTAATEVAITGPSAGKGVFTPAARWSVRGASACLEPHRRFR
jgi:lipopolysaccharide transport system ATP-binding protein